MKTRERLYKLICEFNKLGGQTEGELRGRNRVLRIIEFQVSGKKGNYTEYKELFHYLEDVEMNWLFAFENLINDLTER